METNKDLGVIISDFLGAIHIDIDNAFEATRAFDIKNEELLESLNSAEKTIQIFIERYRNR